MKVLALALIATAMPMAASAQSNPLVGGTWLHAETVPDTAHPGAVIRAVYSAQFTDDGRLVLRFATAGQGGSGEVVYLERYAMTGPSSYRGQVVDREPKWVPAMFGEVGSTFDCQFRIDGPVLVVGCNGQPPTTFTRQ